MHNKIVTTTLIAIVLMMSSHLLKAQLIDNKLNLYAGYTLGSFHGSPIYQEDNFEHPSFYTNLQNLKGLSLKSLYIVGNQFGVGFYFQSLNGTDWLMSEQEEYINSQVNLVSILPMIRLQNKTAEEGIRNRLTAFIELGPSFGNSSTELNKEMFDVTNGDYLNHIQMQGSDQYIGIQGSIGVEFALAQFIGIYSSYSLTYNWIESQFYPDENFAHSQITIGLFAKILKDKRYYY